MTEVLFAVGIAVFFLTVYGVVITGGYLLKSQAAGSVARTDVPSGVRFAPDSTPRREDLEGDR